MTVLTVDPNMAPIPPTEVNIAPFRRVQNTPEWTTSGTLDYSTPTAAGRLFVNTTLSCRSSSQQFELRTPMLDQDGFLLLDANLVWRSADGRYSFGVHGKNLTDTRYITAGYNFLTQNPYTGEFIRTGAGRPIPAGGLGQEGVLTAYYGNPRQVFLSFGVNF
jgi:iron complex outermembrane recepter protein